MFGREVLLEGKVWEPLVQHEMERQTEAELHGVSKPQSERAAEKFKTEHGNKKRKKERQEHK